MTIVSKDLIRSRVHHLQYSGFSLAKAIQVTATELGLEENSVEEALIQFITHDQEQP